MVAFESRRAVEFARLLAHHGARYVPAPALREIPLADQPEAHRLFDEIEQGRVDALVLLTGVGTRALIDAASLRRPQTEVLALLGRIPLIARGPKPVAVLREFGLRARARAPEPNTWRELLEELDRTLPVQGLRVAVQEYGRPNRRLMEGLEQRGAETMSVPVYRWALPEDTGPLENAIERILSGDADVVVFTTAIQLDHLLAVAADRKAAVLEALRANVVIASIGPSATEALRERDLEPAIVPAHPKLGYLASAIAEQAPGAIARQRGADEPDGARSRTRAR